METPYHTKTQQMTATDPNAEMENYDREYHGQASHQTMITTYRVINQDEATPQSHCTQPPSKQRQKESNPTPKDTPTRRGGPWPTLQHQSGNTHHNGYTCFKKSLT
jgi:hypothetical protein